MRHQTSSVPKEISRDLDTLTQEMKEFGVAYVGHGVVSSQGDHSGYFSHDAWRDYYFKNSFFHTEPILDSFLKNPLKIVHWKKVENNTVAKMRREIVQITTGLTICNWFPSYFCFLNIAFQEPLDTEKFFQEHQMLIAAYHQNYDKRHLAWRMMDSENSKLPILKNCLVDSPSIKS